MPVEESQPARVVCVPDAEQLASTGFFRNQLDPLVVSIAKHQFERVDMSLKQAPQR
jgi:hypothetical protein